MKNIENKKVYRCDIISSVDGFLSAREVLKLEMFGDEFDDGLRNFAGVISDIERLFPSFNVEELMKNFDIEQLEHNEEYRYKLVDTLIELLQKRCNVPEEYFNYAIWACDTPEEVVENYDVEIEDVNCYYLPDAVLLQDLGSEGQLYGVPEIPECILEESMFNIGTIDSNLKENSTKYDKINRGIIMDNKEELFNRIYEECVCASGASGISSMAPQHMMACVDQKAGDVSRFTGGNGGKKLQSEKDVLFQNDTMKVHKRKGKKGDAITGTGVVYANGKFMEALKEALDNFDWEKMELSEAYKKSKLNETQRAPDGTIISNKEGDYDDWTILDSFSFACDLLDEGKIDLNEEEVRRELHKHPYFTDLFDAIRKSEDEYGPSTNIVGWENVASDELDKATEDVYDFIHSVDSLKDSKNEASNKERLNKLMKVYRSKWGDKEVHGL